MKLNRRTFLVNSGTLAAAAVSGGVATSAKAAPAAGSPKPRKPYEGIGDAPFAAGEPCLQAPAETTMGVAWKVSGLSKGVVEIADNPEMRGARTVKAGGYGLVPIDVSVLQVRLENLKPATTYWYRTVSTPFTDYKNIYDAKLGKPVVGKIHSFTTMGATAHSHFCMMCDTHARWEPFELIVAKLKFGPETPPTRPRKRRRPSRSSLIRRSSTGTMRRISRFFSWPATTISAAVGFRN